MPASVYKYKSPQVNLAPVRANPMTKEQVAKMFAPYTQNKNRPALTSVLNTNYSGYKSPFPPGVNVITDQGPGDADPRVGWTKAVAKDSLHWTREPTPPGEPQRWSWIDRNDGKKHYGYMGLDAIEWRKNLNPIPPDWEQQLATKGYVGSTAPVSSQVIAGQGSGQKYQGTNPILSSSSIASPAGNNITSGAMNPTAATAVVGGVRESEAERNLRLRESPEYQQYMADFVKSAAEARTRGIEGDPMPPSEYFRLKSLGLLGGNTATTSNATIPQTPIPQNWMDVVNKAVGQKYAGTTQYGTGQLGTSPAGNNITSGTVNPTTALSGNNLATTATAPGAGASTFGTSTSFFNPASGTANQKRKTGANKYFNQQWFGGKQML